ncbi:hypothetical protein PG985_003028 [Apiospora marii]|uniref:uncharacterized protein n=1 Tax=Apiospora marii TaxID=335849 RepID=UPI00313002D6
MAGSQVEGFALIVGAAGGIGREVALTFAEAGLKGALVADVDEKGATQVSEQSKALASNPFYQCLSTRVDVTDVASVDAMVKLAVDQFGRIDYCINAFGVSVSSPALLTPFPTNGYVLTLDNNQVDVQSYVPFDQTDPTEYDRVLGINAKGMYLVIRAVAKVMQSQDPSIVNLGRHGSRDVGRGAIVNVSSMMAHVAVNAKLPYTTSKHAITGITKAAVMDYKPFGIRINQVCPIWVKTPMFEEECRKVPQTPQFIEALSPIKRPIEPDEVAAACLYLCNPRSVPTNGASLTMDTGLTAGPMIG